MIYNIFSGCELELVDNLKILVYGAGAVGSTVGGWINSGYSQIYLKARGEHAAMMRKEGLILYLHNDKNKKDTQKVKIINDLNELPDTNVVIFTVKNYDLEEAAKDVSSKLGENITIVSLQNYVEPQRILPKYFKNVIYGIVAYNTWIDEPGLVGYKQRGLILLGILDPSNLYLKTQLRNITSIFNRIKM